MLIQLQQLGKNFTNGGIKQEVLNSIDFSVNEGQFVALRGSSGSGKSTLLSIIGLLDTASTGHYHLCGHDVNELNSYQKRVIRNKNLGWIFQNFNLINDLSVYDNVLLPLKYAEKKSASEQHHQVMTALTHANIESKARAYPSELSGGQQQRVAIARAIVNKPDILLADEPTGNLDSQNSIAIFKLLQRLNRDGTTILLVTHEASLAELCQVQYTIDDGKLV